MLNERLSGTIDHFFSFIQADEGDLSETKKEMHSFFQSNAGTHVVHDSGAIYFYEGKKLLRFSDIAISDTQLIHTFDGKKITAVTPYNGSYKMKSGDQKSGGTKRRSNGDSGGVSSNNNNNNNNNG
ncbi:MAG: hypothetical protein GY714_13275 [Desulfobacterales bacterium]|nr:hypothetical protein [Desulfobacterales bacterium]MCP4159563.1 hypothetical protein [Deltaproteobacteria bacterium]